MTRSEIIDNLKDEERRAIVMGCTDDYIEMLGRAYEELEKLEQIDALVNDSCLDCQALEDRIREII